LFFPLGIPASYPVMLVYLRMFCLSKGASYILGIETARYGGTYFDSVLDIAVQQTVFVVIDEGTSRKKARNSGRSREDEP
jgi:hypothetical protein